MPAGFMVLVLDHAQLIFSIYFLAEILSIFYFGCEFRAYDILYSILEFRSCIL